MKAQAQMMAGDQGVTENLAPAQKSAVPDGHHQTAVGTVQNRKVPWAGQRGKSRARSCFTRRARAERGGRYGDALRVARTDVEDVSGGTHRFRIAG